jgi:hypothetical protein
LHALLSIDHCRQRTWSLIAQYKTSVCNVQAAQLTLSPATASCCCRTAHRFSCARQTLPLHHRQQLHKVLPLCCTARTAPSLPTITHQLAQQLPTTQRKNRA